MNETDRIFLEKCGLEVTFYNLRKVNIILAASNYQKNLNIIFIHPFDNMMNDLGRDAQEIIIIILIFYVLFAM